ncbi:Sulfotransferase domain protein [Rhodobacteraceae bacterium THAF1]|uniref:sulfotransferase domain-containing protein n=1 Tax=Palleronia sp. THAF1 TaxID=2587842 RepID=UPI000F3B0880|nr:sulfotransferase domain-containing protein [Palleronia sp. THAF1]QFU10358.1 Sulfotransferase domain protein [Palleronia sp. THAF1]VDC31477.1 Sulfotransferase domain protein [Rhodobacteraceae bacterium THAF1]
MINLTERAKILATAALRAKPDFLIIGAQKAGTTSLHSYLAHHPKLRPAAGRKELHYFNFYYDRSNLAWYLSHFPYKFRRDGALLFEATPDYLMHDVVPTRIRRDLGPVRMIAVLREPVERAYSAWRMWHHFAESKPDLAFKADSRSFACAINDELSSDTYQQEKHFHYVRAGHYAEQLEAYHQQFCRSDILVVNYTEMSRDLGGFLQRICRFLGVDGFTDAAVADMGKQRHWVTPKVEMTDDTKEALDCLRSHYAPHNARLFDLLGERWDW